MVTLYAATGTGSTAVQAVLAYTKCEHEIVWLDYSNGEHHSADFLAINPRGQIPALKLADGTVITESAAIMLHLADCVPEAGLTGVPGSSTRAEIYRWMIFIATNVYEDFLRMRYPHNYTMQAQAEADVSASGAAAMARSWGIVSDALGNKRWLVGDQLSVIEIYMAMLISWHPDIDAFGTRFPNLLAVARQTITLPGIKEVFETNESVF